MKKEANELKKLSSQFDNLNGKWTAIYGAKMDMVEKALVIHQPFYLAVNFSRITEITEDNITWDIKGPDLWITFWKDYPIVHCSIG